MELENEYIDTDLYLIKNKNDIERRVLGFFSDISRDGTLLLTLEKIGARETLIYSEDYYSICFSDYWEPHFVDDIEYPGPDMFVISISRPASNMKDTDIQVNIDFLTFYNLLETHCNFHLKQFPGAKSFIEKQMEIIKKTLKI